MAFSHQAGGKADPAEFDVILLAAGCSRRLAHLTQDLPKSFLPVAGRSILERNLAALQRLGFERITAIVGYRQAVFHEQIGTRWGRLRLRYVESPDFASTGHGWSLFQARELWRRERRPVLLVHADVLYDGRILEKLLDAPGPDVAAVDNHFESKTGDEVLVHGDRARITGIRKIGGPTEAVLGEVVGLNRWSPAYMEELFEFMDAFFAAQGRDHNWEPVVDAFLAGAARPLRPLLTDGLPWININYEEDLRLAELIAATMPTEANP